MSPQPQMYIAPNANMNQPFYQPVQGQMINQPQYNQYSAYPQQMAVYQQPLPNQVPIISGHEGGNNPEVNYKY